MNPTIGKRQPSRLAGLVHQPGGVTIDEAVEAADTALETIREEVTAEIYSTLERMLVLGHDMKAGYDKYALDELYVLANTVVGMAGVFGMHSLGEVSFSLCELVDRLKTMKKWDGPAMQVHMDSLRLLRPGATQSDVQQKALVGALRRIVARV